MLAFDTGTTAMSQAAAQFILVNQSSESCRLEGYPTLQFLDVHHQALRAQVLPSIGGYFYITQAPQMVVLPASGHAYFVIEWGMTGTCATPIAFLQVTPPENQAPLLLAFRFCPDNDWIELSPLNREKVLLVFD